MRVTVFSRTLKVEDLPYIRVLLATLASNNVEVFVFKPYFEAIKVYHKAPQVHVYEGYDDLKEIMPNFFISLGGDGTILEAVTHVRETGIPIVGINLGRLGFLAYIEKNSLEDAIYEIIKGKFELEERQLIQLVSNPGIFGPLSFALNDFTIHKRDTSSMITIHTYVNNNYLNSYWADGIILATPTGSTGYSLSCGGPIVYPNSGNFVLTPIAPHNLNVRPIVISDNSVIKFKIEGRAENYLCTLDSRYETITAGHELAVQKNSFAVNLVQLKSKSFLDTMREKLTWGVDARNH